MGYSRDISLLCRLCWPRHAVIAALRITTLQKPLKVYMMCSLYASVQAIENSPFLPHGVLHGLRVHFSIYLKYLSKNGYKTTHNPIGKPNNTPPIKIPMIN